MRHKFATSNGTPLILSHTVRPSLVSRWTFLTGFHTVALLNFAPCIPSITATSGKSRQYVATLVPPIRHLLPVCAMHMSPHTTSLLRSRVPTPGLRHHLPFTHTHLLRNRYVQRDSFCATHLATGRCSCLSRSLTSTSDQAACVANTESAERRDA